MVEAQSGNQLNFQETRNSLTLTPILKLDDSLNAAFKAIKGHNNLKRIADKSKAGWAAVDEHLSSAPEDEEVCAAEQGALTKEETPPFRQVRTEVIFLFFYG